MAKGLLLAAFDFAGARADEFHDWYDTEHVPERLGVPGFLNAERWIGDELPTLAIATYDLESPDVMNTPAYQAVAGENVSVWTRRIAGKTNRLMRFEGEQLVPGDGDAPVRAALVVVTHQATDEALAATVDELGRLDVVQAVASVMRVEADQ